MASKKKAKAPKFDTSFNFGASAKTKHSKADRQSAAIFYSGRGRR